MIHTIIASTPEEIQKVYNLRYKVYCLELVSLNPDNYPNDQEIDAFDQYSVHVAAKDGDTVIGTLRLVKDNPMGFVMESTFTLPTKIDRAKTVEHSRGVISNSYRGQGIYTAMLEEAYKWQRSNNYPVCIGAPNADSLYYILKKHKWNEFGIPTPYHNITVVPMMFTIK